MDPVLEVRPSACLFLLGPQLTRRESERMSYRSVLETGFTFLQQQRRRKRGTGYVLDLEELRKMDVVPAMQGVIGLLRKEGLHKEWLRRTFGGSRLQSFDFPDSLQWMLELQQMGALLVCTQYDTLLDDMAGQSPVTLCSDDPRFVKWLEIGKQHCSRREPVQTTVQSPQDDAGRSLVDLGGSKKYGILHLHGVHTKLESISLLPYGSVTLKNSSTSGRSDEIEDGIDASCVKDVSECLEKDHLASLRGIFHNKLVLMIGFDGDCRDPLLPSLLRVIYPERNLQNLKNPPIFLTSSPPSSSSLTKDLVLQLQLRSLENLRDVLLPGSSRNFTIGRELMEVSKNPPQAFLLFNEKQSFRKLGEIIYQQSKSGEIYVCRDALTVVFDHTKILYGNLVTYAGNGLRQLWELVFAKDSLLEAKGLLGVGLQRSVIVWMNKKPKGITNITGINSVHTNAAHKAIHTMALAQRPLSTSSTSSADSFSDSRSPPFCIPVSTTAQIMGLQQPPAPHPSLTIPRKKDRRGGGGRMDSFGSSSSSASSAAVLGNSSHSGCSTSLSPLLSAPVVPPSLPSFFNPSMLQREVTHNHIGSKLLTASPTSILNPFQFSISAPTPTPISISQISGSQSILPSLPFLIPPVVSDLPKFPPVTSLSYLYPHSVNPVDLEKLTNLNRQLSSQLQASTHAVSPVADNNDMNTNMKASLATSRLMEWKGVIDSAPPMTKEFTHCVAGPAEILQLLSSYQEHMKIVLAESEHKIECIDTQSIHRNSDKKVHGTASIMTRANHVFTSTIAGHSSVNTISPPRTKVPIHTVHHLSLTRDSSQTAVPSSSVTPSVPTLEVPSLSVNYPSSLLGTAFSQPNLTGSIINSGNNLLAPTLPLLFQTQQTFGLLHPSPPRPPTLNYCILPPPLQQISGTSRSNTTSSPPPTGISVTNMTAIAAAAALPSLPQSPLIAGAPMPQTGEIFLNSMAPGGMNICYLVHTLPATSAVQPVPTTATILQVDPPAALMLQGVRTPDQSINNLTRDRLRNSCGGSRIGIADGTNAEKVSLKRKRCADFPDCMGEEIVRQVNPSAKVLPFSSPSKYNSSVVNQNHWSGDLPGRSVSDVAELSKFVPQGPFRESSSSESEESTQGHKSSKRR